MLYKYILLLSFASWVACEAFLAKQHQNAARQADINLICGSNPVDCGDGECCFSGQKCITGSNGDPLCEDLLLTDVGGGPMTFYANPYSSILGGISSIATALTSDGLTLSTFPSTTLTGIATALPTYSFTQSTTSVIIPTWTGYPATATATTKSTGNAPQFRSAVVQGLVVQVIGLIIGTL